jgi:hypothetical protein
MKENGMSELQAVLGSLNTQCVKDAQRCSEKVSAQYNVIGFGPSQLVMVAYDDLA